MKREATWTLKELLSDLIAASGGGHPSDYIEPKTAKISLASSMTGPPKVIVEWDDGFDDEAHRERYWESLR